MFVTGTENSAPTIRQGTLRVNEMERCGPYRRWREDFELVRELGTWPPDRFDWTCADQTFSALRGTDFVPVVISVTSASRTGSATFQNPDFRELFDA
jgi:beta-glucosidase